MTDLKRSGPALAGTGPLESSKTLTRKDYQKRCSRRKAAGWRIGPRRRKAIMEALTAFKQQGWTFTDICRQLDVSKTYLGAVVAYGCRPSHELALKLELLATYRIMPGMRANTGAE